MNEKDPIVPIIAMNPISEAGFPDTVCPVIFLPGCNFHCPYCMNSKAVINPKDIPCKYTKEQVLDYLQKEEETNLLISGGEPCLHNSLPDLINYFKDNGINIRLSTNGSYPVVLKKLLDTEAITFVAMDIKTPISTEKLEAVSSSPNTAESILESLSMLDSSLGDGRKSFSVEFRTTLYPEIIKEEDIREISRLINPEATWVLQQYRVAKRMLGAEAYDVKPYSDQVVEKMLSVAKENHQKTYVRWP